MKTDKQLLRIFNDIFENDTEAVNEAMRDSQKAFSYISRDALYWMNNFLEMEDE